MDSLEKMTIKFFERAGFSVTWMVKEDFWLLNPGDEERRKYGAVCLSSKKFREFGVLLKEALEKHD